MGAFFTNVQVFLPDGGKSIARVVDAVRTLSVARFEEISAAESGCHRGVLIVGDADSKWITVYDQETENQDEQSLAQLAGTLSAGLRTSALAVLVHDSDILQITLFANGKQADSYRLSAGGDSDHEKVDLAKWKTILAPGSSVEKLKSAFEHRDAFVESVLAKIATELGLNVGSALIGYNYATENKLEHIRECSGDFQHLKFDRIKQTPAKEPVKAGPSASQVPSAPSVQPKLRLFETLNDDYFVLGGTVSFNIDTNIEGALWEGVSVVVDGPAVREALVGKDHEHQLVGGTLLKKGEEYNFLVPQCKFAGDACGPWSATIKDKDLGSQTAKMPLQLRIYVNRLAALKEGSGIMRVTITPVDNPSGGCTHEIHINVVGEQIFNGQGKKKNRLKSTARKLLRGTKSPVVDLLKLENGWAHMEKQWGLTRKEIEDEVERLRQGSQDVIPQPPKKGK